MGLGSRSHLPPRAEFNLHRLFIARSERWLAERLPFLQEPSRVLRSAAHLPPSAASSGATPDYFPFSLPSLPFLPTSSESDNKNSSCYSANLIIFLVGCLRGLSFGTSAPPRPPPRRTSSGAAEVFIRFRANLRVARRPCLCCQRGPASTCPPGPLIRGASAASPFAGPAARPCSEMWDINLRGSRFLQQYRGDGCRLRGPALTLHGSFFSFLFAGNC